MEGIRSVSIIYDN